MIRLRALTLAPLLIVRFSYEVPVSSAALPVYAFRQGPRGLWDQGVSAPWTALSCHQFVSTSGSRRPAASPLPLGRRTSASVSHWTSGKQPSPARPWAFNVMRDGGAGSCRNTGLHELMRIAVLKPKPEEYIPCHQKPPVTSFF